MQAFFPGQASAETLLGTVRRVPLATDTSSARPGSLGGSHGRDALTNWVVSGTPAADEWDAAHV